MKVIKQTQEPKQSNVLFKVLKENPELISPIKEGDTKTGTLIYKDRQKAFFDIDGKNIGIIYGVELMNATDILKNLNVGDSATLTILEEENEDGNAEISLVQAFRKESWQKIHDLKKNKETIKVKIKSANSGGLLTSVHEIKAFIPVSQLSVDKYPHVEDGDKNKILEELKKLVGQELEVKIMDVDQNEDKLILSEREVKDSAVKETLSRYKNGMDVDIIVSGIADFGVFVRIKNDPDIEGLVHISEIDHKLIESPKDIVKVGDILRARVLEIKNGRISFSFKALKENPWDKAKEYFKEGQEIEGKITRLNSFGALVAIGYELQGLIHVSEFEDIEEMAEKLEEGKEYKFIITQINPEEKRILLRLKS